MNKNNWTEKKITIQVQLTVIFWGYRTNFAGFHKLYFYTKKCKLDLLPNHISLFEIV